MTTPPSVQKTTEVCRPRSSQHVSVTWDDDADTTVGSRQRLQFEVAECVETRTVTTTTTTKRSYPPLYVRERRSLRPLDTKEYPLAAKPTPPELSRFTVDLYDFAYDRGDWSPIKTTKAIEGRKDTGEDSDFHDAMESDDPHDTSSSQILQLPRPSRRPRRRRVQRSGSGLSSALSDRLRRETAAASSSSMQDDSDNIKNGKKENVDDEKTGMGAAEETEEAEEVEGDEEEEEEEEEEEDEEKEAGMKKEGKDSKEAKVSKLAKVMVSTTSKGKDVNRGSLPPFLATPDKTTAISMERPDYADRGPRLRSLRLLEHSQDTVDSEASQGGVYDAASPTGSDSHTIFSNTVATPPIMEADTEQFTDPDEAMQQTIRTMHPRVLGNVVGVLDASLPSPRLSPTLSAAHPVSNPQDDETVDLDASPAPSRMDTSQAWSNMDTQQTSNGQLLPADEVYAVAGPSQQGGGGIRGHSGPSGLSGPLSSARASFIDSRNMLEQFDGLPNDMKSFMMYQFLRRCTRKTLHMIAETVNPALQCDFFKNLPLELSYHILSYLDFRDLCRCAQVSKHWRNIVDSNETGWKELFDRDGFELPVGELRRAIAQGWGWQDPVGAEGCEMDLSMRNRMTSTETELIRSSKAESAAAANAQSSSSTTNTSSRVRSSKRKRGMTSFPSSERSKRRASAQELAAAGSSSSSSMDKTKSTWPLVHKSEGPISAANAAAVAVPDPQIGLASLRKLHLFKSLYRRHYMIRQSWTSGKVKPGHVAFAAHPRHVITCLQFDDDKIITGSDDTLIHVYDTKTGKLLKKLEGHEGGVWALQYEGNILVSGSTDRSVRVWDIEKGLCTQVFYGHTSTVRCLQILMPSKTGEIKDGQPVMMPPKPLIITGSRDNHLRVWRLPEPGSRRYIQTGPPANDSECPYFIRILAGHSSSVRSIAAHGDILVSGSYDSTVRVWRISTGEALHVLHGHSQRVYSVVLDTKRNRCISGSMDSLVKIWDLATGSCLHTLEGHALLVGLLDLRDEKLVSAAADSTLRVWDPETGRCKSTLTAHTGAITCFQHDGRKVISGSEKTVKMWDIQTGECIHDLLTDLSGVWQVKFDERRCVAAVQRDSLTYIEILDFGAVRDGKPPEELGKRILLNGPEVDALIEEEI